VRLTKKYIINNQSLNIRTNINLESKADKIGHKSHHTEIIFHTSKNLITTMLRYPSPNIICLSPAEYKL